MQKKQTDKKIFTEAESPIPVIPTDQAWVAMQQQLDRELPLVVIIPPVRKEDAAWKGTAFVLLSVVAGIFLVLMLHRPRMERAIAQGQISVKEKKVPEKFKPVTAKANVEVVARADNQPTIATSLSIPPDLEPTSVTDVDYNLPSPNIDFTIQAPMEFQKETPGSKDSWAAGLQWQMPVPFRGTRGYFAGPSGSSAPYLYLLPSAWVGYQKNRNRFMLEVNPFQQALLPDKPYSREIDSLLAADSSRTLVKTFGFSTSLQYAYEVRTNWWLGATVQANWWKKGLIFGNDPFGPITEKKFHKVTVGEDEGRIISSFQVKAGIEVFYLQKRWSIGLQTLMPVTSPFSPLNPYVKNPIQVSLIARWQLLPGFN